MIFTKELLSRIEKDNELKKLYAGEGSLGQNKWMALPIVVMAFCAFAAYYLYTMSSAIESSSTYLIICGVIAAACLFAVIRMRNAAMSTTLTQLDDVPVCLAKRIYGNDNTEIYYSIYTTGPQRHEADFIEAIADKIINIQNEPDAGIRKTINSLFQPSFNGNKVIAEQLPLAFTFDETVYMKEIKFMHLNGAMKQAIAENNGKFVVFAFNRGGVPVLKTLPA